MTGHDLTLIAVTVATLFALTYAITRLLDEWAARREERDNATYWARMQREILRARRDVSRDTR
jgi:hypothetical protein